MITKLHSSEILQYITPCQSQDNKSVFFDGILVAVACISLPSTFICFLVMLQGSDISPFLLKGASPRKTGLLETPGTPPENQPLKKGDSELGNHHFQVPC